jgi:hypothetical protein
MDSGKSEIWNIKINLFELPPLLTYPPYFKFDSEDEIFTLNDGSIQITKYI